MGTLLFVSDTDYSRPADVVKVAYTGQDTLDGLLNAIQVGNPNRVRILGLIRNKSWQDKRAFRERYDQFSAIERGRDWYRYNQDIKALVDSSDKYRAPAKRSYIKTRQAYWDWRWHCSACRTRYPDIEARYCGICRKPSPANATHTS